MEQSPLGKYSRSFLTMLAILLTFFLLLASIWLWYDLRLTTLDKTRDEKEQPSSKIRP